MIVGSGAKMLDGYPRDPKGDATKPYVIGQERLMST